MVLYFIISVATSMCRNIDGNKLISMKSRVLQNNASLEIIKRDNLKCYSEIRSIESKIDDLERQLNQNNVQSNNDTYYKIKSCISLHRQSISIYKNSIQRNNDKINEINSLIDKLYQEMRNC